MCRSIGRPFLPVRIGLTSWEQHCVGHTLFLKCGRLSSPSKVVMHAGGMDALYDSDSFDDSDVDEDAYPSRRGKRRGNFSELDGKPVPLLSNMSRDVLYEIWLRLRENDIDYGDMKHLCKDNGLGGKDMKNNLRAKLIRRTRELLGMKVWDAEDYLESSFKRPDEMTDQELMEFFKEREVHMPEDSSEAVQLALAMLAVDGVIDASQVPSASNYEKFAVAELKVKCRSRGLPSNGNKQELIQRLQDYDSEREKRELMERASIAAQEELDRASIYIPPRPPNYALEKQLQDAQASMAAITTMKLPELRAALLERDLPVYGTREVLVERMTDVLRRDVVEAHAGQIRLIKYAAAAVRKLAPEEVYDELSMRGMFGYGANTMEDSASRLINTLVDEWVQNALMGWVYQEEQDESPIPDTPELKETDTYPSESENVENSNAFQLKSQDPTMEVVLVCCGATVTQREHSLQAARVVLPRLQTDPVWGTLMPPFGSESTISPFINSPELEFDSADANATQVLAAPEDPVNISLLTPLANGVLVTLAVSGPPPPQTVYVVRAIEIREDGAEANYEGNAVFVEGQDQNLVLQGLKPETQYKFTAYLRNAAGNGPEGEPYYAASVIRQGISVTVLYEYLPPNNYSMGKSAKQRDPPLGPRYMKLSWEHLHACSAAELDARFHLARSFTQADLGSEISHNAIIFPLGPPSFSSFDSSDVFKGDSIVYRNSFESDNSNVSQRGTQVVTSWADQEIRKCVLSRHSFCSKANNLGYSTSSLFAISHSDILDDFSTDRLTEEINSWLAMDGEDPLLFTVTVRLEYGGEVLDAGIGRGAKELAAGAVSLLSSSGTGQIILEKIPIGGIYFKVSVLETKQGPIALVPTGYSYEDIDEELEATDLELQRYISVLEGIDPKEAQAMMDFNKHAIKYDPIALGLRIQSRAQRVLTHTPPRILPAHAVLSIRLSAAKMFKDLELKDYAEFSGWIVPDNSPELKDLKEAINLLRKSGSFEETNEDDRCKALVADHTALDKKEEQKPKGKTFAELKALDASERQKLSEESITTSNSSKDKSSFDDTTGNPVSLIQYESDANDSTHYGEFIGVPIDDRSRDDIIREMASDYEVEEIPEYAPWPEIPTGLPDLDNYSASDVCRVEGPKFQGEILFNGLSITPQFSSPLAAISQQAAAVGLELNSLIKRIVSAAAVRAGICEVPFNLDDTMDDVYEEWPTQSTVKGGVLNEKHLNTQNAGASFQDIERDIEQWEKTDLTPGPLLPHEETMGDMEVQEQELNGEPSNMLEQPWLDSVNNVSFSNQDVLSSASPVGGSLGNFANDMAKGNEVTESENINLATDSGSRGLEFEEDIQSILAREYPGLHPSRQRVWILFGGEGHERDDGLQAAAEAVATLQGEQDLLVEAFCLEPHDANKRDLERRRSLFQRRLDLLKLGSSDYEILQDMPEFHPSRIRHVASPDPEDLRWRGVWRLSGTPIMTQSLADLSINCEEALNDSTTSLFRRKVGDEIFEITSVKVAASGELDAANEPRGGTAPWGGCFSPSAQEPRVPRYCFLEEWVTAAASQCVVVLLVLPGHPSAQGPLQQLLESRGIPYTGPSASAASLCADRVELLKYLEEGSHYDGSAIQAIPYHSVSLLELNKQCASEEEASQLFDQLSNIWDSKMLVIRPAKNSTGKTGFARLSRSEDLRIYNTAINNWIDFIQPEVLAKEPNGVSMNVPPPTQFVIEPLIEATPLTLFFELDPNDEKESSNIEAKLDNWGEISDSEICSRVQWPEDRNGWLEIRACLSGGLGSMRCLGLTTSIQVFQVKSNNETSVVGSFDLTPPPTSILSSASASEVSFRLQLAADQLGLSGAATISALVNPSKLEIILLEVDAHPQVSRNSLLMKQAAVQPLTAQAPVEVLRDLLKIGMTRSEAGLAPGTFDIASGGEEFDFFSDEDFDALDLRGEEGLMDNADTGALNSPYYGDPYMRVDWVSGEGN